MCFFGTSCVYDSRSIKKIYCMRSSTLACIEAPGNRSCEITLIGQAKDCKEFFDLRINILGVICKGETETFGYFMY